MFKEGKGFTLIELLAVIVVLSIIIIIAIPMIVNEIEEAEKGAFRNTAYGIIEAAELEHSKSVLRDNRIEEITYTYENGKEKASIEGQKLDYKGTRPQNGFVKINKNGEVALAIHNGKYCAKKGYTSDKVSISKRPVESCQIVEPIIMKNPNPYISEGKYLNGPIDKTQIESIKFVTEIEVPKDAIGSWDVSEKKNYSVVAWYHDKDNNGLYEVTIGGDGDKVYANPDSSDFFAYLTKVTSLDLSHFNTSKVVNMVGMFWGVKNLTSLDVSNFDTSQVIYMDEMFGGMKSLTSLDLSNFDTSKVTDMSYMFYESSSIKIVDFRNANFSSVTSKTLMFRSSGVELIYAKDATAKAWLENAASEVKNVQIVIP